jgi:hypothetical protein
MSKMCLQFFDELNVLLKVVTQLKQELILFLAQAYIKLIKFDIKMKKWLLRVTFGQLSEPYFQLYYKAIIKTQGNLLGSIK